MIGFFCIAVEKSVAPRGDQISVIVFQPTAPPSRVNFREIRAPGVCIRKIRKTLKIRHMMAFLPHALDF